IDPDQRPQRSRLGAGDRVLRLLRVRDGELEPARDAGVLGQVGRARRRSTHVHRSRRHRGSHLRHPTDTGGDMTSSIELTADDEAKVESFAGDLFMACLATLELANVELGIRLGLYEAMAGAGGLTARELTGRAGIAEDRKSTRLNSSHVK